MTPALDDHTRLLQEGVALLALTSRNAEPALRRFEAAQAVAPPHDGTAWLNAGVVLDQLGRNAEAEASFREGVARDPAHYGLWTNLAYVVGRRDAVQGIAAWRELLARWPDDAVAWVNLGTLLERAGQPNEARVAYERGLSLDAELAEVVRERLSGLDQEAIVGLPGAAGAGSRHQ